MARELHVAKTGNDWNKGTKETPFATIQKAADTAMPGDTVIVHEGTYREWVDPKMGGNNELERITYCAAPGEKVILKGSEQITGWEKTEGTVWKAVVPNTLFGDFNPYNTYLYGDWMVGPQYPTIHLGDVYLNGKSFFEALSVEEVQKAEKRESGYSILWVDYKEPIPNADDTIYQWYAKVDEKNTTIWANFHGADPNEELVEINVRKCVFYPKQTGVNYITVSGFEMAHAATPFAPPTGDQPGLVGPHWSKGWIIEDNHIHDAKCSAVSLGKDEKTGDNLFTKTRRKPGYTYQFEAVAEMFDEHPSTYEEYIEKIEAAYPGDEDLYVKVKQPVYIARNVYLNGAKSYVNETDKSCMDAAWKAGIVEEDGAVYLELEVDEAVLAAKAVLLGTEDLGCTRAVEGLFENPNGTPITFDTDYCGTKRYADAVKVGPLAGLKAGYNKIRVW